jgi:probable rRNA maturation factor
MTAKSNAPQLQLSIAAQGVELPALRAQIRRWVKASHGPRPLQLHIQFVDSSTQQTLNRDYRNKDYATNVLTFVLAIEPALQADVIICPDIVQKEALEQGKPFLDHLAHLVIHGTLHAQGFDHEHPEQAQQMEALETALLKRFRIPNPYLT